MIDLIIGLVLLIFSIFVPGYFLTFAFFPSKEEIDKIERVTLSFAFSIAFIPMLLFILNIGLKIPITAEISWGVIFFFIVVGVLVYFLRNKEVSKGIKEEFNEKGMRGAFKALVSAFSL